MSRRIQETFSGLKQNNKKALISFIMAHDGGTSESLEIMKKLPKLGVDIIELGMPFSDPMADGKTIQHAGQRALANSPTMLNTLGIVKDFRKTYQDVPVVLMGYYNPLLSFGLKKFVKQAKKVGVDGLIIVDLPIEEDQELFQLCEEENIDLIKLVTPTTTPKRLEQILHKARGFIYYVSITGVTGGKMGSQSQINKSISMIRKQSDLPIAVGFGIDSEAKAKSMSKKADAVVVGSALIKELKKSRKAGYDFIKKIANIL